MAALLRAMSKSLFSLSSSRSHLPSLSLLPSSSLISRRGIAYKLFVQGLSFYTTDKSLLDAFAQYGQVLEAKVVLDRVSDKSKGFGFVTFASEDEAHKALSEMNGKALHGRVIYVDFAKPSRKSEGMPIARGPPEKPKAKTEDGIDN